MREASQSDRVRSGAERVRALRVEAGGRAFLIDAAAVRAVERPARVARLPGAPPWVRGVARVRDDVVPVVSLARRLDLPPGAEAFVVVVDTSEPAALAVDAPGRVVTLAAGALTTAGVWTSRGGALRGRPLPCGATWLDPEALLLAPRVDRTAAPPREATA